MRLSKIDDERTKLTATFLNGIATAMVVAGAIVPLAAFSYAMPGSASGKVIILVGLGWAVAGLALHLIARRLLGRLSS